MSYDIGLAFALVHQRREIVPLLFFKGDVLMKKIFQTVFMFTMGLPIKCKTLIFIKKEFNNDILKLERMIRELYSFFTENYEMLKDYKIILYYDNGQHHITRVLNNSLAIT